MWSDTTPRSCLNARPITCLSCDVWSIGRFPHGTVDDIEGIAALTSAKGISLHVDNCLGGFLLSHLQAIGEFKRPFDFLVLHLRQMANRSQIQLLLHNPLTCTRSLACTRTQSLARPTASTQLNPSGRCVVD